MLISLPHSLHFVNAIAAETGRRKTRLKVTMPFTINASGLTVVADLRFPAEELPSITRLDKRSLVLVSACSFDPDPLLRLLAKRAIEKADEELPPVL